MALVTVLVHPGWDINKWRNVGNNTWAPGLLGSGGESGSSAQGVLVVVLVIKKIPIQHANGGGVN